MKYRKSFVTNSSSSSYLCEVCGEVESGYDMSITDACMYECENEHVFCEHHAITPNRKQKIKYLKEHSEKSVTIPFDKLSDDKLDELLEPLVDDCSPYEYPSLYCPICNMEHITDEVKLKYLMKAINIKDKKLQEEILSKFDSYEELIRYVNS